MINQNISRLIFSSSYIEIDWMSTTIERDQTVKAPF